MLNKFLIVQTAFIGDVILTIPMISELKKMFPDSIIDFLCIPKTMELLENNPYVNSLIVYDKHNNSGLSGLLKIAKIIKESKYNAILSPHRSFRSTFLVYLSRCKNTIGFNISSLSILYKQTVNYIKNIHDIQRNLMLLKPLDIVQNKIVKPQFFVSEEKKMKIEKILVKHKIGNETQFITVAPGSIWFTKRFPFEKFAAILKQLRENNTIILLIGSEDDYELCEQIKNLSDNQKIVNLAGRLSLLETIELIRRSKILLTNDSAPLHMANAVGTKVLAIFGATILGFGFYPYGSEDVVFEINNLECRPCAIHGGNKCPIETFDCMNRIEESEIVKSLKEDLF
ncbi:MAG TPA: glycosyltransferase family 9 protein [Ignavibacteria bacterium]